MRSLDQQNAIDVARGTAQELSGKKLAAKRRKELGRQLYDVVAVMEEGWPETQPEPETPPVEEPVANTGAFRLLWPVDAALNEDNPFGANPEIYRPIGYEGHPGIDFLASFQPVYACEAGTVVLARAYGTAGNAVRIRHDAQGAYTRYCHFSEIQVTEGQWVERGQQIGISGDTGYADGPHLHLDLWLDSESVNNGYQGRVDAAPYLERDDAAWKPLAA